MLAVLLPMVIAASCIPAAAAPRSGSLDRERVQLRFDPAGELVVGLRNGHRGKTAVVKLDGSGRQSRGFAGDGVLGPFRSSLPSDLALSPNGRILLEIKQGPEYLLRRYLPSGDIDRSFGDGTGTTIVPFDPRLSSPDSIRVFVQPRGEILVSYHTTQTQCYPDDPGAICDQKAEYLKVHRYNRSGRLLEKVAAFSEYWQFGDAAGTPGGGLVVVGTYDEGGTTVLRLTSELNPDPGFGDREGTLFLRQSKAETGIGGYFPDVKAMAPAPRRGIVIAPRYSGAIRRYRADGRLDRSFGDRGTVACPRSSPREPGARTESVRILRARPAGALLVAGGAGECGLASYGADGSPDHSFGSAGFVDLEARGLPRPQSLAVGPDGQIAVAGWDPDRHGTVVTRFSPRGHLVHRFGEAGSVVLSGLLEREGAAP